MVIPDIFSVESSISFPFNWWVFFEGIKLLCALLWDLDFSRILGKKWVPLYTTVAAYFMAIAQPFPIFRKLLGIISSMENHPHLIILNKKINVNNKSPYSTSTVLLNQL